MKSKRRIGIACLLVALSAVAILGQSEGDKRRNATTGAPQIFDGRRWRLDHKALGRRVETVADLSALALDDGDEALLLGYSTPGDAGDPWQMIYRATGRSGITVDGGFYIAGPGADDYWEAVDQSVIYMPRFGVLGSGDETSGIETLMTLADTINDANTTENRVWIDGMNRNYTCTVDLTVAHPYRVSMRNMRLVAPTTDDVPLTITATNYTTDMEFQNVVCAYGKYGAVLTMCHFMKVDRCTFSGTIAGLRTYRSFGNKFVETNFGTGRYGYVGLGDGGVSDYDGDHTFDRCSTAATEISFLCVNDGDVTIPHGSIFRSNLTQGPASIKYLFVNQGSATMPVQMQGNYLESPKTVAVDFSDLGDIDFSLLNPTKNGTGAKTTSTDPADGEYCQFFGSWVTADHLKDSVGVHESNVTANTMGGQPLVTGTESHCEVGSASFYAGASYASVSIPALVHRFIPSRVTAASETWAAMHPYAGTGEFDPTVTNYVQYARNDNAAMYTAESGTQTYSSRFDASLGGYVVATSGIGPTDLINISGRYPSGYLVSPDDSTKFALCTLLIRSLSGNANVELGSSLNGFSYSPGFTVGENWVRCFAVWDKTASKRCKIRIRVSTDVEIARPSFTVWDDIQALNVFLYSGKVGGDFPEANQAMPQIAEQSADPSDPPEGRSVLWQSDGTGSGDDGDWMVKITAGGVTKTVTLVDFSAF